MATKNFVVALAVVGLAWGTAWGAGPGASDASPKGDRIPTFYKDLLPLVQKNCQSCHRPGQIGPFSLLDYQSARPWAKAIKNAVTSRKMPPWLANPEYGHFNNDRSLSQGEINTIVAWANNGAPAGDPKDGPPPVARSRNWGGGMGKHTASVSVQRRYLGDLSTDSARQRGGGTSYVL